MTGVVLAIVLTALVLGVALMVVGMITDLTWLFLTGGLLAIAALLYVLGSGLFTVWAEVLSWN